MMTNNSPTCVVVRPGKAYEGAQQLSYFPGISAESAGAQGLCMHVVTIPPGGRAAAHLHRAHETAIYVLSGEVTMRYGEGLREELQVQTGDFLYIPAGMPHLPVNTSASESARAIVARTDPNEQEGVVLLPDLD
jgi:uncharacterized RmlC-like cupin family protein